MHNVHHTPFTNLATSAAGSWLVALLIPYVNQPAPVNATSSALDSGAQGGWLPDDLNKGHADYFFLLLAAGMALNLVVFMSYARTYTYYQKPAGSAAEGGA
jgi:peptide/histidine transporter 3/4